MTTQLVEVGELLLCREMLASGRGLEIVRRAGLPYTEIARATGVSGPTAWSWFCQGRQPQRATALRLVRLLVALEGALDV